MADDDDPPQPGQEPGKIPLPEDKEGTLVARAIEQAIRFSALANAGGVVTTLSVFAAVKDTASISALAWPLGLFAAGVACALLTTCSMVFIIGDITNPTPDKWTGIWRFVTWLLNKITDAAAVGMVLCFLFGVAAGIFIIANAS